MYQPAIFREERIETMHELMRAHPFATLVSLQAGSLAADHLPLVLQPSPSGKGTLRGHAAKSNPLAKHCAGGEILAIFQGPHAYVSPSWYPSEKEHGRVVPAWNYAVVHTSGTLRLVEDREWLLEHLNALTRQHEARRPVAWEVGDAPRNYLKSMLNGLIGIELVIERLEGKWKMSQNRDERDRLGVQRGLALEEDEGAKAVSRFMGRFGA